MLGGVEASSALAASLRRNTTLRTLKVAAGWRGGAEQGFSSVLGAFGGNSSSLTALDISERRLDPFECTCLGESLARGARLEELTMAGCFIGPRGAAAFLKQLESPHFTKPPAPVRLLNLQRNGLGAKGATALVAAIAGSSGNARRRARAPLFSGLQSLNLSDNNLGDAGVAAMMQAGLGIASLTELDVRCNGLSDAGCVALARHFAAARFGILAAAAREKATAPLRDEAAAAAALAESPLPALKKDGSVCVPSPVAASPAAAARGTKAQECALLRRRLDITRAPSSAKAVLLAGGAPLERLIAAAATGVAWTAGGECVRIPRLLLRGDTRPGVGSWEWR